MEVKAIETTYKGYRFRSRLEARYAVFFDALGLRWEYEKEGYDLGPLGWYLPDFYLPELQIWVEIKGERPTLAQHDKCIALRDLTGRAVYITYGPPLEYWGHLHCWDLGDDSGGCSEWSAILGTNEDGEIAFTVLGWGRELFSTEQADQPLKVVFLAHTDQFDAADREARAANAAKAERFS